MDKIFRLFLTLLSRGLLLTVLLPAACFAKAGVAKLLGDDTPEKDGRLTMDFRRHTGREGILMVLLLGFGYGREMNFDVSKVKNMKRDITLINLAAPLAYFLMYVLLYNISGIVYSLSLDSFILACLYRVLRRAGFSCLCFGTISLLPLPPLEGFQIFYQFSWPKFRRWYFCNYQKITRYSMYILYAIFLMEIITDGEFSVLHPLVMMWNRIWEPLVFFRVDWEIIPYKFHWIIFE